MSGFLINRDLKALKSFPQFLYPFFKPKPDTYLPTGDHAYFKWLASHFKNGWGKSEYFGDPRSMLFLDSFLKHLDDRPGSTQ
jgi:hypothetical protein